MWTSIWRNFASLLQLHRRGQGRRGSRGQKTASVMLLPVDDLLPLPPSMELPFPPPRDAIKEDRRTTPSIAIERQQPKVKVMGHGRRHGDGAATTHKLLLRRHQQHQLKDDRDPTPELTRTPSSTPTTTQGRHRCCQQEWHHHRRHAYDLPVPPVPEPQAGGAAL